MTEQLSKNTDNLEKRQTSESENVTVNDASFNVTYKPHEIPSKTETMKSQIKEKFDQTSNALSESMDFSMEALLKQAWTSLDHFLNQLPLEQRIPSQLLKDAKGIMFLTVVKGGLGLGGLLGTGIIIARNPSWRTDWTAPCAIGVGGLQIGLNIGIEKIDHIIILRDENIINKFHSGIRLGGDISLSVGPLGRDANIGLTMNEKGVIPNVSYSMSKGAYVGFALEGSVITIRNDCNERYLGEKCDVSQILNGSIKAPFNEHYNSLCNTLSDYATKWSRSNKNENIIKDENHPILNVSANTK